MSNEIIILADILMLSIVSFLPYESGCSASWPCPSSDKSMKHILLGPRDGANF
jgi:hypothetical protein